MNNENQNAEQPTQSATKTGYKENGGQRCETCYWFRNFDIKDFRGSCAYEVKFPDSTFARSPGMKKNMHFNDGRNCPCWEDKTCHDCEGEYDENHLCFCNK